VGVLVCDLDEAALGEDVETKVAALLGPFAVLFGQDDADEPYQRGPIGGDADDVGAAADSIEPFLGIVGRDLPPRRLRERGGGQDVGSGASRCCGLEQHTPIDRRLASVEVCTLFATGTWACRSGSPARLSRWVNAAATRPRTLTCRMLCGPVRANKA
jgi:hypothetical protein